MEHKRLEFKLFTRSTCPLCDEMEEELIPLIKEHNIVVHRQYIDNYPELEQLYGTRVPVLTFDDKVICEYFLDPERLLPVIQHYQDEK